MNVHKQSSLGLQVFKDEFIVVTSSDGGVGRHLLCRGGMSSMNVLYHTVSNITPKFNNGNGTLHHTGSYSSTLLKSSLIFTIFFKKHSVKSSVMALLFFPLGIGFA